MDAPISAEGLDRELGMPPAPELDPEQRECARSPGRPPGSHGQTGQLQKLSVTHHAIMDFLLLNPGITLQGVASHFNYSVPGIGFIIRSDAFQAALAARRMEIQALVAESLPKKLEVLGHLAVEKLTGVMEKTNDPDLILDSFDKVMHRLGYAPVKGGGAPILQINQQNVYQASSEDIANARAVMLQAGRIPSLLPPEVAKEIIQNAQETPAEARPEVLIASARPVDEE